METRIKKILFLLISLILFTSCNSKGEQMNIIAYGTDEFKVFLQSNPNIDLETSWDLQLEYYKNNEDGLDYNSYKSSVKLFFIVDNNYVYTLNHILKKEVKGKLLEGIWVNADTGDVKYKKEPKIVEAKSYTGWVGKK